MNVLVTGAAGFIGSHLVRALLREGHSVRAIDNLSTGYFWRLEEIVSRIEWIEGDITDRETVLKAVSGIDVVLHQAAIASVARSLDDPLASDHANVTGTLNLLQACREKGVKRLVFAGSSSAYGSSPALPKVETMCPLPMSPYAVSKLTGEQYCKVFADLGYVETVTLRYFNIFGPMQDPTSLYSAVIPKFAVALLEGTPIKLDGDGTQSRDFTYIDNAVQANLLAMTAVGVSDEVFNVGCGARYDLNQLIRELGDILGIEPIVENCPPRLGDIPHSLADISKARNLLGYNPTIDFTEGLRRTAEWFRAQHNSSVPAPPILSHLVRPV